jgi:dipeptidyl aminopeptidase/acylaminoacyl peptidase
MCGAAFEPDLYRCAITIAGVFDWSQVISEKKSTQYESAAYGIFRRNLGDPQTHHDQFDAISPLRHVDQVKIPVFVAHGQEDEVADVQESRALIAALETFNVPHESLLVAREGHGMSYAKNQIMLYDRIAAFLDKNLLPAK